MPEHGALPSKLEGSDPLSDNRSLPRTPENCHLVVEAKHLGAGVEGALKQALGYVESLGIQRDVRVTDGVRYWLYAADKNYASVA